MTRERTMTVKTTLNGLPLYEDSDPMDVRDGYNRAMVMIDKFISRTNQAVSELKERTENDD